MLSIETADELKAAIDKRGANAGVLFALIELLTEQKLSENEKTEIASVTVTNG